MSRHFRDLTKRGQTSRLRQLALGALPRFGLVPSHIAKLADGFNTLFRLDAERGRGPVARYVVRVHRSDERSDGGFETEHRWLAALARDVEIDVPRLVLTQAGEAFALQAHPGVPEARRVSVFEWREGTLLGKSLTPIWARSLGEVAATLHAHTERYRALDDLAPKRLGLFGKLPDRLDADHLPATAMPILARARHVCDAGFASLAGGATQLCHFDLHPGNVLVTPAGRLALIDFDDCAITWPAFDVSVALFYLRVVPPVSTPDADPHAAILDAFGEGYTSRRPWPASPSQAAALVIARQLMLLNHLIQETDAELRAMVPGYLTKVVDRLGRWLDAAPQHG